MGLPLNSVPQAPHRLKEGFVKAKKMAMLVCSVMLEVLLLTGRSASPSTFCEFDLPTGDKVTVSLGASDGLKLIEEDDAFIVSRDGEAVLGRWFVGEEGYDRYAVFRDGGEVEVVEESEKGGSPHFMYETDGELGPKANIVMWFEGHGAGTVMCD